ncbi:hypothetical protein [Streptobacillus moniliformis]|uniref:hypothetical protein n=1 Tax=Streptobacillus moniliformis TaxID=34105 RepID=UPI0007E473E6|nr:hypothetical protein [Streptobacillus moniliformis]
MLYRIDVYFNTKFSKENSRYTENYSNGYYKYEIDMRANSYELGPIKEITKKVNEYDQVCYEFSYKNSETKTILIADNVMEYHR